MLLKKIVLPLVAVAMLGACATSRKSSKSISKKATAADTTKKTISKLKPYKDIITNKAITDDGLFKVHKVEDKYYFEIPDSLLDRDILFVTRIAKGAFNYNATTYSGDYVGEKVIQFYKGPSNKLFVKQMDFMIKSTDTSENGMNRSVENTNMDPYAYVFDIKTFSSDSAAVIDVTSLVNSDNDFFFFANDDKKDFAIGGYQADKSYIESIQSYPLNVEIKTVKTYSKAAPPGANPNMLVFGNITLELNNSFVLLPKQLMQPRYMDERVGYFARGYFSYDASRPVSFDWMTTRWRLEPKVEDVERYKRGELVEPVKPIVFYIDPATPKKWVPYLMEGVKDWQKAFEKAGFKNAIYALEAPKDDSTWSMEDARHSVIVYKASYIPNASGPHVHDPRTGEIIESHVDWYHNVQELLHDWYMVQAGSNDPKARKMEFDDALMGQLIRYVCAHEVGHTLGLQHNFASSATVPVDSLRSKSYVQANGFCPSIMDYSRFNYVAQPEDGLDEKDLMPRIGVYDEWAIEWGYKWLPQLKTREQEKAFMNHWIISKIEGDKRLVFGSQTNPSLNTDPSRQSEDVGDDAVKAGHYGIQNLKRIIPQLKEWTKVPNSDYESLKKINLQVILQYFRYVQHAAVAIGGAVQTSKTVEQKGDVFTFVDKKKQKSAVQFLQNELFTQPGWLMNNEIFTLSIGDSYTALDGNMLLFHWINKGIFRRLLSASTYYRLLLAQNDQPANAYSVDEFLTDMEAGIWKELATKQPVNTYRRDIQKLYVDRLISQLDPDAAPSPYDQRFSEFLPTSDVYPVLKGHLRNLLTKINNAIPGSDNMTKYHLIGLKEDIEDALYDKELDNRSIISKPTNNTKAFNLVEQANELELESKFNFNKGRACWSNGLDWDIPALEKLMK